MLTVKPGNVRQDGGIPKRESRRFFIGKRRPAGHGGDGGRGQASEVVFITRLVPELACKQAHALLPCQLQTGCVGGMTGAESHIAVNAGARFLQVHGEDMSRAECEILRDAVPVEHSGILQIADIRVDTEP